MYYTAHFNIHGLIDVHKYSAFIQHGIETVLVENKCWIPNFWEKKVSFDFLRGTCVCAIIRQLLVWRIISLLNEKLKLSYVTCLFSSIRVGIHWPKAIHLFNNCHESSTHGVCFFIFNFLYKSLLFHLSIKALKNLSSGNTLPSLVFQPSLPKPCVWALNN